MADAVQTRQNPMGSEIRNAAARLTELTCAAQQGNVITALHFQQCMINDAPQHDARSPRLYAKRSSPFTGLARARCTNGKARRRQIGVIRYLCSPEEFA
jgi:hypothetical protein